MIFNYTNIFPTTTKKSVQVIPLVQITFNLDLVANMRKVIVHLFLLIHKESYANMGLYVVIDDE